MQSELPVRGLSCSPIWTRTRNLPRIWPHDNWAQPSATIDYSKWAPTSCYRETRRNSPQLIGALYDPTTNNFVESFLRVVRVRIRVHCRLRRTSETFRLAAWRRAATTLALNDQAPHLPSRRTIVHGGAFEVSQRRHARDAQHADNFAPQQPTGNLSLDSGFEAMLDIPTRSGGRAQSLPCGT